MIYFHQDHPVRKVPMKSARKSIKMLQLDSSLRVATWSYCQCQLIMKHWCQNCLNEEQALEFTIDRRNFDTGRNSVLAGANLEFLKVGERCENTKFSTLFECDVHRMISKIRGTSCKTFHHYETGHMFYEDTECL